MDKAKEQLEKLMTKERMSPANVAIAILFGIAIIVAANLFFEPSGAGAEPPQAYAGSAAETRQPQRAAQAQPASYAEVLERRLESILRTVDGVGNVRVMLTFAVGAHRVYAENVVRSESQVSEVDSAGGRRDQRDVSGQHTTLTVSRDGNQEPVLLREYEPKVEGVIISAQGADDARVRAELATAAQTVLGLEVHQVQVLRMTTNGGR
ncbi:MAG: hypothetical protein FWD98_03375 [Defluviitaleaceae bacterium]|nr:hypothetical protein [Defluviitaleaceae bacterium]